MKSEEKRTKDWTPEERISALIDTGAMTPEECSKWCRKKGTFPHHLEQWKKDAISGISKAQKIESGHAIREDTTVSETNFAYPVDRRLLNDSKILSFLIKTHKL